MGGRSLNGRSFRVVYGDPPWLFDLNSEAGEEKSPQAQYSCMPTVDICRQLKDLLEWCMAPDSVFVMWCTWPMMARGDCHQVMRAAGFEPKTGGSWGKLTANGKIAMGTGYIYRSADEPWLIGTRGNPRSKVRDALNLLLDDGMLDTGMLLDVRREHSRKPESMVEMIERQFDGPYLELYARERRQGWESWGNQVDHFPV